MSEGTRRRLTTIIAADIAGFSRLVEIDEEGTLIAQRRHRHELIEPLLDEHRGRVANTAGDSLLLEFPSAVEAVRCAIAVQEGMAERNRSLPAERRIEYRIGVNVGDVVAEGDDLLGDGVNVAARLEALAEPGGICISNATHEQIRDRIDVVFADMGDIEVKNITRPVRVFRVLHKGSAASVSIRRTKPWQRYLAGAIVVLALLAAGSGWWWQQTHVDAEMQIDPALEVPDKPSIAVLPFDNLNGDAEQNYISDGIASDLITDLSQISGLFVIARSASFDLRGKGIREVGRELGVRYVLGGSVQKAGQRVRVNAQLVEVDTGGQLWADRYDRQISDVLSLQDDVARKIVNALTIKLTAGEAERLNRSAKVNPDAWDMLQRGLALLRRFTRENNVGAREYFENAIAIDPQYARAHANLALTYALDVEFGWTDESEQTIARGLDIVRDAMKLDESVPQIYFSRAHLYLFERRHEQAIAAGRKALEIDPNYADAYAQLALTYNYAGQPELALDAIAQAIRLNPLVPFVFLRIKGQAFYVMGRYDEAIAEFQRAIDRNPEAAVTRLLLTATYAQAGRIEDAEWEAQEVLNLLPEITLTSVVQRTPYKNPVLLDRFIEALGKAGIPD